MKDLTYKKRNTSYQKPHKAQNSTNKINASMSGKIIYSNNIKFQVPTRLLICLPLPTSTNIHPKPTIKTLQKPYVKETTHNKYIKKPTLLTSDESTSPSTSTSLRQSIFQIAKNVALSISNPKNSKISTRREMSLREIRNPGAC